MDDNWRRLSSLTDQDGVEITVMSFAGGAVDMAYPEHADTVFDWLLLSGAIASLVPFLIGNGVVFLQRKRRYFQAIGWDLILGNSVAAVIWVGSTFVVNQHFRRVNFLGHCSLWTFWFQLTFGISLWMTFTALRIHHLYSICEHGKPPSIKLVWGLYIPLLMAPSITFATVATVLNVSHHPDPDFCHWKETCVITFKAGRLSSFLVLPPLYFTLVITQLWRVRKHQDYLLRTQCQHIMDNAMMTFVLYLLTGTATYWTNSLRFNRHNKNNNNVEGRCFLTFSVCSIVFIHFWVHTGWPIYLCLFRGGDEMDKYEESLRRRGAHCLQRFPYEPRVHDDGSTIDHSWAREGEEAIFQALAAEQTKKDELKMKRDQLRNRLTHLRGQLDELKHQKTVPILPHASQSMPPVRSLEQGVVPHSNPVNLINPMTRHLSLELSAMSWPTANTLCKYSS